MRLNIALSTSSFNQQVPEKSWAKSNSPDSGRSSGLERKADEGIDNTDSLRQHVLFGFDQALIVYLKGQQSCSKLCMTYEFSFLLHFVMCKFYIASIYIYWPRIYYKWAVVMMWNKLVHVTQHSNNFDFKLIWVM